MRIHVLCVELDSDKEEELFDKASNLLEALGAEVVFAEDYLAPYLKEAYYASQGKRVVGNPSLGGVGDDSSSGEPALGSTSVD